MLSEGVKTVAYKGAMSLNNPLSPRGLFPAQRVIFKLTLSGIIIKCSRAECADIGYKKKKLVPQRPVGAGEGWLLKCGWGLYFLSSFYSESDSPMGF